MARTETRKRPNLVLVSDETRRLCVFLAEELLRWPDVTTRPMFGMRAFYRGAVVFAMLPDKRAFDSPTAIMYKLPTGREKREGPKWRFFELEESGIQKALTCLDRAYNKAALAQKP